MLYVWAKIGLADITIIKQTITMAAQTILLFNLLYISVLFLF